MSLTDHSNNSLANNSLANNSLANTSLVDLTAFQETLPGLWQVLQEMYDGAMVCQPTPEGRLRVLTINKALSGLLPNTVLLQLYCQPDLMEVIESEELKQLVETVLQRGASQTAELLLPLGRSLSPKPSRQYFEVHGIPLVVDAVNDQPVTTVMVMFNDTTEIRRTEKMRRDFVANVSHELRTPLSAIKGYAETLMEGALEDEEVARDFVKVILKHSLRLSQLVEDLLDLSKLESPDFRPDLDPMSIQTLVSRVFSLIMDKAEAKQLNMKVNIPDDLPLILADSGGLEQVVTNLLDNAIKYTPVNGSVTVTASPHPDNMVRIDVQDTGMGIEPKYINRVFERFYRVDKARSRDMGGTGLGLSIVKHIVQLHGGDIWVDSTPNIGSTFSFTLQIAP